MNKKILGLVVVVIVACAMAATFLLESAIVSPSHTPKALDFTVSGTND